MLEKINTVELWKNSVIINILVFIITILFLGLRYETPDDSVISLAANAGIQSEYLVYINIYLGKLFKYLYQIVSDVNWYAYCLYLSAFCCLTILTWYVIKNIDYKIAFIIGILFCFTFGADIYSQMQYTKISIMLMVSGIILIREYFINELYSIRYCFIGMTVLLLGPMVRFESLPVGIVFGAVLIICDLITTQKQNVFKDYLKSNIKLILVLLGMLVVSVFLYLLHQNYYFNHEVWSKYMLYNEARVKVLDYKIADYNEFSSQYHKIGITESDYNTLISWLNGDPLKFTTEKLIQIAEINKEENTLDILAIVKRFILNGINIMIEMKSPVFFLLIMYVVFLLLFTKKNFQYIIGSIATIFILYLCLTYIGRIAYRVEYGVILSGLIILVSGMSDIKYKNIFNKCTLMKYITLVFLLFLLMQQPYKQYNSFINNDRINENGKIFDLALENTDSVYFYSPYALSPSLMSLSPFHTFKQGELLNLIPLGGWTAYTARVNEMWKIYNVTNPFTDLVLKDNAYLIDNSHIEIIVDYLESNYFARIDYSLVQTIGNLKIYKLFNKSY